MVAAKARLSDTEQRIATALGMREASERSRDKAERGLKAAQADNRRLRKQFIEAHTARLDAEADRDDLADTVRDLNSALSTVIAENAALRDTIRKVSSICEPLLSSPYLTDAGRNLIDILAVVPDTEVKPTCARCGGALHPAGVSCPGPAEAKS